MNDLFLTDPLFGVYTIPSFSSTEIFFHSSNSKTRGQITFRNRAGKLGCYATIQKRDKAPDPPTSHHYFDLTLVLSGEGFLESENNSLSVCENDVLFLTRGKKYRFVFPATHPAIMVNLCFLPSLLGLPDTVAGCRLLEPFLRNDQSFRNRLSLSSCEFKKLLPLAFAILENFHYRGVSRVSLFRNLIMAVLGQISTTYESVIPELKPMHPAALRAVSYIREHPFEKVTLRDLASVANLEPHYFSCVFNKEVGQSLRTFVNRERIEAAKALLSQQGPGILEITDRLGFASPSHFSRIFRKYVGQAPREFAMKRETNPMKIQSTKKESP